MGNIAQHIPQINKNFNDQTNGSVMATFDHPLTVLERNLLTHIRWYKRKMLTCFEGMKSFAEKFNVSERQIQRAFKRLREFGYITMRYMGKRGNALKFITDKAVNFLEKIKTVKNRIKRSMSGPKSGPMSGPKDLDYIDQSYNENNKEEKCSREIADEALRKMKLYTRGRR